MIPLTDSTILDETLALIRSELKGRLSSLSIAACRVGVFFTALTLNTRHAGLAFTPIAEIPEAVCCPRSAQRMPDAGNVSQKPVEKILEYALSHNVLKSAIGVALINALSDFLFDAGVKPDYEIHLDQDGVDLLDVRPEERICLVGAFTPYIRKFKTAGNPLTIIERHPDLLRENERTHFRTSEQIPETLKEADVIIATGASIVNHTFDELLEYVRPEARMAVIGPTVSMIPDIYFREGVDLMAGVRITEPDVMLQIIGEGGSGYHLFKTCARKITFVKRGEKTSWK